MLRKVLLPVFVLAALLLAACATPPGPTAGTSEPQPQPVPPAATAFSPSCELPPGVWIDEVHTKLEWKEWEGESDWYKSPTGFSYQITIDLERVTHEEFEGAFGLDIEENFEGYVDVSYDQRGPIVILQIGQDDPIFFFFCVEDGGVFFDDHLAKADGVEA